MGHLTTGHKCEWAAKHPNYNYTITGLLGWQELQGLVVTIICSADQTLIAQGLFVHTFTSWVDKRTIQLLI